MSVQLSTKTDELDQMLIALGKRGIQLGDGIRGAYRNRERDDRNERSSLPVS